MSLQFIIDGYNIINHPLFSRTHKSHQDPRLNLASFIKQRRLTGSPKNKITIVFDGYPDAHGINCDSSDIDVIFARKISADEKIKMLVEESANRKNIVVVSEDKDIKFMVRHLGARHMGIEEFIGRKEKTMENKQKKDFLTPELTYTQMHKINQELRKIWLK